MFELTKGSTRKLLAGRDVRTLREKLDLEDLVLIDRPAVGPVRTGSVFLDETRRRPLYFDGRFLAARDLTREQTYFLARQADLGRAGGAGVVHGLMVRPGSSGTRIIIEAGHGIAPNGELVLIDHNLELDLADIASIQRLDLTFGLSRLPAAPAFQRSGLFILTLRAVEYTANPIASYPTSITGPRTVEDGDIVEATAVSLVPYQDEGNRAELGRRRSHTAWQIFVQGRTRGIPAEETLPLAMLALERGVVRWIDNFMVRREVGAEHGDVLGMGFAPRANREAYLLQYDQHIQELLAQRNDGRFAASEFFDALPPAGRMPAASVNPLDLSQIFFPKEMDVELSFIPQDELRIMIEDSLLLPPIDLTLPGELLESTSLLVVAPVPRHLLRRLRQALPNLRIPLRQVLPGLISKRRPIELLATLDLSVLRPQLPPVALDPVALAWRQILERSDWLWYMRRRDLSYKEQIVGQAVQVTGDDLAEEAALEDRFRRLGRLDALRELRERMTGRAAGELSGLFTSPKLLASTALTEAAVIRLLRHEKLDLRLVMAESEFFANPKFGDGIIELEKDEPLLRDREVIRALIVNDLFDDIDRIGVAVVDTKRRLEMAREVIELARSRGPEKKNRILLVNAGTKLLLSEFGRGSTLAAELAGEAIRKARTLDNAAAKKTSETLSNPNLSVGLTRLESALPDLKERSLVRTLSRSDVIEDLSNLGTSVKDPQVLKEAATKVADIALARGGNKAVRIRSVITDAKTGALVKEK